ncbi:MAG: hypothetical protein ABI687_09055 [Flavitalea sp.]
MRTERLDGWDMAPRKLSLEEIEEPEKVIAAFYDYARLPQVRDCLWEGFKTMVSGTYPRLKTRERYQLIHFFEQVERLVEATHIIHARNSFN